jgi:hypothetical protein
MEKKMLLVAKTLNTSGNGLWSNVSKPIPVTGLELDYINDDEDFGELKVYFDTGAWNVNQDGLIYTDRLFLEELLSMLSALKLGTDVSYSEQGMQGDNYVSLDVGAEFIKSYQAVFAMPPL